MVSIYSFKRFAGVIEICTIPKWPSAGRYDSSVNEANSNWSRVEMKLSNYDPEIKEKRNLLKDIIMRMVCVARVGMSQGDQETVQGYFIPAHML